MAAMRRGGGIVMKLIQWSMGTLLIASATAAVTGCDNDKKTTPAGAERTGVQPDGVPAVREQPAATERVEAVDGRTQLASSAKNRGAVEAITAARCDREQRCNNIGSGKKYESQSSCVTNVRSDWQGELSSLECPNGIDQAKLDTCLERLRSDGCANPVETLGRVTACRQAALCRS
jgi:hypothetical protein